MKWLNCFHKTSSFRAHFRRKKEMRFQLILLLLALFFYPEITFSQWDVSENRLRLIGQPDLVSSQAGSAMNQLDYPCNVALDLKHGKLYVADQKNNRILRFAYPIKEDMPTAEVSIAGFCYGLALAKDGTLWATTGRGVCTYNQPWKISNNPEPTISIGTTNIFSGAPQAITFDSDANLWLGGSNYVICFPPSQQRTNGSPSTTFISKNSRDISGFCFVGKTMYVSDISTQSVLRFNDPITRNGTVSEDGSLSSHTGAYALTTDSLGNLYIANHRNYIQIYVNVLSKTGEGYEDTGAGGGQKNVMGSHGVCVDMTNRTLITSETHSNRIVLHQQKALTYRVDYSRSEVEETRAVRIDVTFSTCVSDSCTPKIELRLQDGTTASLPPTNLIRVDACNYVFLWHSGSGVGSLKPYITDAIDYMGNKVTDEGSSQPILKVVKPNPEYDGMRITFGDIAPRCVNDSVFTLSAIGGASTMPVNFFSSDTTIASCSGENGRQVTVHKIGVCSIYADQDGDGTNWFSAQEERLLEIRKCDQSITFPAFEPQIYAAGLNLPLKAAASSLLPLAYTTDDPKIATIENNILRIHSTGTVHITASQAGNSRFFAARPVEQLLEIRPDPQAPITTQAHHIVVSPQLGNTVEINWQRGDGERCVVFIKETEQGFASPQDGVTYTANVNFPSGDQIDGSGWYCVYNGTSSNVSVSGLDSTKTYTIMVCEYNGQSGSERYLTIPATDNPKTKRKAGRELVIYTFFSPNNDGRNDTWLIENADLLKNSEIYVFTRSLQTVYHSIGYPEPWNGKDKGRSLPNGEYYYRITGEYERKGILVIVNY